MQKVNKYFDITVLNSQTEEDLVIHEFMAANDLIDHDKERITQPVLKQLSEQYIGKDIILNHDSKSLPEGKIVKAETRIYTPDEFKTIFKIEPDLLPKQEEINALIIYGAFPVGTDIQKKLRTKIVSNVSIGFYYSKIIEKGEYKEFDLPVEADELSVVRKGAQRGAQIIKSKDKNDGGTKSMDTTAEIVLKEQISDLKKANSDFETKYKSLVEEKEKLEKKSAKTIEDLETKSAKALEDFESYKIKEKEEKDKLELKVKTLEELIKGQEDLVILGKNYIESIDNEYVDLKVKLQYVKQEEKESYLKEVKALPYSFKSRELDALKRKTEEMYRATLTPGASSIDNFTTEVKI